jgi:hypothetical protein
MVSLKVLVRAAPILAGVAALAGCGGTSHPGTMSPSAETIQGKFVNVVKTVSPAVVQIQTSSGLGSGVVFDASPRRLAGSRNGRPAVVTTTTSALSQSLPEASVSRSSVDALRTRPQRASDARARRALTWIRDSRSALRGARRPRSSYASCTESASRRRVVDVASASARAHPGTALDDHAVCTCWWLGGRLTARAGVRTVGG